MPWNDNANPGPWGSPPPEGDKDKPEPQRDEPRKNPPPRRPQPPPGEGVDLNEVLERWNARLRGMFGGGNGGGGSPESGEEMVRRYAPIVGGLLVAVYLAAGFIVVGAKEKAVVTTFGAHTRNVGPGIGYHLPIIEGYTKVGVTTIRETKIGGEKANTKTDESLMLTGDENIVDIAFAVNWRVSDPAKFLFNVANGEDTVKAVAESAMREVVGRTALDPIISTGRGKLQADAAALMQRILNSYDAGVVIDSVQVRDAQPPASVVAAFQDVAAARQNYQARVNEANGRAAQIRQAALGYKAQAVNEAVGEAQRFNQIYEQYRLAPGVTRQRLYIETMGKVLARSNKVIVDSKGASAPIILPPDVFKPKIPNAALNPQGVQPAPRASGAAQ
jgi:membrane protease subunit HflK